MSFFTELQQYYQEKADRGEFGNQSEQKTGPQEVVIKPEILDTSSLEEDNSGKEVFRPQIFDQYIGQEDAKQRVKSYIDGCKKFNETFPHTLLSAPAGCGKTVFANIIANHLDQKFVKCGAVELKSEQQLVDKIVECNGNTLLIDECHKLSSKIATFMLPILEEGLIAGKKIKPFTMLVATTHKGNLSENLSALVQRFLPIELEHYNQNELIQILKQYKNKTYPNEQVGQEIYKEIVSNAKYTPRIAIRLLREYIYTRDINVVKKNNKIVKDGLTKQDIKALRYLNKSKGCGKNSIAKYLNVEPKTYEFEVEPFLISKEFIEVSSRRKITPEGKMFLESLK